VTRFIKEFFILLNIFYSSLLYSQNTGFISTQSSNFILNKEPFLFSGANAYYSAYLAAQKDTNSLIEVFTKARLMGMKVIRIWGFYDSDNNSDPAVIQSSPGRFNENALRALDYVLMKASEFNLRIIICLTNNWENYGGMNQYVKWLSKTLPAVNMIQTQRIIYKSLSDPANNSFYRLYIDGLTHDDFYSHPTIRQWFKNYLQTIITRINFYKNISYKNDTTIMAWELANEAESSEGSGVLINNWINEMAEFIKSIDNNHLVGTGESGFDVSPEKYSNLKYEYNNQTWIYDGNKGISFYLNTLNRSIDFASCHLYREDWRLPTESGKIWIEDHKRISAKLNKPFLLGEYGTRKNKKETYNDWLNTIIKSNTSGALLWQLVYNSMPYNDGYFVYYPNDADICYIIQNFSIKINEKMNASIKDRIFISQNYPNPCSNYTTFEYSIPNESSIKIETYNVLGQKVMESNEQEYISGSYTLGINTAGLANGVYFTRFSINNEIIIKKFQVVK
jgi:mannan endo-1,4-beta-mannosidase